MRIVGIRRPNAGTGVEVAALTEHGTDVTVIATLAEFWANPAKHLSRPPDGPTLPTASIEQVPPPRYFPTPASSASG